MLGAPEILAKFYQARKEYGLHAALIYLQTKEEMSWHSICELLVDTLDKAENDIRWRKKALEEVTVIQCTDTDCGYKGAGWLYNPCPECHGIVSKKLI